MADRWFMAGCLALLLLGAAVRLPYVMSSDFPLNDGGMFSVMIDQVRAHHFSLPRIIPYNGNDIPFVYPPFPFFLGAFIETVTGQRTTTLLRWLPLLLNLLCIQAMALLGRSILRSPTGGLWAGTTLALVPTAYIWEIMGGGLTRSAGFLFMILALWQASELLNHHGRRWVRMTSTGVFTALTVLSHPARPVPLALGIGLLWLAESRSWWDFLSLVEAGAVALALTTPWWIVILGRFGLAPWQAASLTTRAAIPHDLSIFVTFTAEATPMLFTVFGIVGIVAAVLSRWWYLPVWMTALFFVLPNGAMATACIPMGLLVGLAIAYVIEPGLNRFAEDHLNVHDPDTSPPVKQLGLLRPQFGTIFLTVSVLALGIVGNGWVRAEGVLPLQAVSRADREAMNWIASSTPRTATFVVLGPGFHWYDDAVGEWFPALADRKSVTTAQGCEWLPDENWQRLRNLRNRVIRRKWRSLPSFCRFITSHAGDFQMIYVSLAAARQNPNILALLQLLHASRQATVMYSNSGVVVFRLKTPASEISLEHG